RLIARDLRERYQLQHLQDAGIDSLQRMADGAFVELPTDVPVHAKTLSDRGRAVHDLDHRAHTDRLRHPGEPVSTGRAGSRRDKTGLSEPLQNLREKLHRNIVLLRDLPRIGGTLRSDLSQ